MSRCEHIRDFIRVSVALAFVCVQLVNGVTYWKTETKDSRPQEKKEHFEYDDNYRLQVSHGDDLINETLTQRGRYSSIVVTVKAFGDTFVLDLHLNRDLFASTYVERSITKNGVVYHNVNHTDNSCFYIGTVRDKVMSTAAVSTCKGIVGYFAIDNITYHVEPLSDQIYGLHRVYRNRFRSDTNHRCGTKHNIMETPRSYAKPPQRLRRAFLWPQDKDKKDKIVELYIASDHSQYVDKGSNTNTVFQRAKDIANVASSLYQPLDIYLVVVGMEVWTDSDRILVSSSDTTGTLNRWYDYRMRNINPYHYNDDGILLTHVEFFGQGEIIGLADVGTMCSNQLSGAFVSDIYSSAAATGSTVAHEMGHNFGLNHDTSSCSCTDIGGNCIMYAIANSVIPASNWSSCSKSQLATSFSQGLDICLYNVPQTIYNPTVSTCGNGIVEQGEQCDCGKAPAQECNSACCNSTTCQFTKPAACSSGRCCDVTTCQIMSYGTLCRSKANDCDLPEFCDGTQFLCPVDTYKPNGTNCTVNGDFAYCYNGQCDSYQSQCELIWGPGTLVSSPICYIQFNVAGLHYGNCGLNWLPNVTYIPCLKSNAMCGKLQCQDNSKNLYYYQTFYLISTASIGSYTCHSVIFDFGLMTQDPGLVPNGAACGDGMMCISQKCVAVSSVSTTPCSQPCQNGEVCNNLGFCQSLTGPSTGSGTNVPLIVGLCILFIVILPLLGLAVFLCIRYRTQVAACLQKTIGTKPDTTRSRDPAPLPTISHSTEPRLQGEHQVPPGRDFPPPPYAFISQVPSVSVAPPVSHTHVPARAAPPPPRQLHVQVPTAPQSSPWHYDNYAADYEELAPEQQHNVRRFFEGQNQNETVANSGRPALPAKPTKPTKPTVPQVGFRLPPVLPPKPPRGSHGNI